jgi:hypothetical protein
MKNVLHSRMGTRGVLFLGCLWVGLSGGPLALAQDPAQAPPSFDREIAPPTPKRHTLSASVEHGLTRLGSLGMPDRERGTGLAVEKNVAEFEIPPGQIAQGLKLRYWDMKTGVESDKLRKGSIYSVTQRKYVGDQPTLPPGKYRFVVGGLPGAMGNLTYETVPNPDSIDDEEPQPPRNPPPSIQRQPPQPPPVNNEGKKWCPHCKKYH